MVVLVCVQEEEEEGEGEEEEEEVRVVACLRVIHSTLAKDPIC